MKKRVILLITMFSYLQVHSTYKNGTGKAESSASTTYGSDRRVGRLPHPVSQWDTSMPVEVLVEKRSQSHRAKQTFPNSTQSTLMSQCLGNSMFGKGEQKRKGLL